MIDNIVLGLAIALLVSALIIYLTRMKEISKRMDKIEDRTRRIEGQVREDHSELMSVKCKK